MNVMIVGANFRNKGAQSMLFVTVDEIRKRIKNVNIYFAGVECFDDELYNFKQIYYSEDTKRMALSNKKMEILKICIKSFARFIIKQDKSLLCLFDLKREIKNIDLIIDISGFNIGSKWIKSIQEEYLNNIKIAKKYGIRMILMPQSFGDFEYSEDKLYLLEEIKQMFSYPDIIFAREEQGYKALLEEFSLNNVKLSTDLVLQNKDLNRNNILKKEININIPFIEPGSVGVVPNEMCFDFCKYDLFSLYIKIIESLLTNGKKVYIFYHSNADREVAKKIASTFDGTNDVIFIDRDFSCFEYDEIVAHFDYIICSRYHGIVHAYKKHIPCILVGWEIKYKELAKLLGQEKYYFDITDSINEGNLINLITTMNENYDIESMKIASLLKYIQKESCFDCLSNLNIVTKRGNI